MSIFSMVDEYVKRQAWSDLEKNPEHRAVIRSAAREVLNATNDADEYKAIVRLAKVLP